MVINCPMKNEDGKCLPVGNSCSTSVNKSICRMLQIAYSKGFKAAWDVKSARWIYCADELPDNCEEVLVCMDDYESITVGNYMPFKEAWLVDFCGDLRYDVAAWMPIPKPPRKYKVKSDGEN